MPTVIDYRPHEAFLHARSIDALGTLLAAHSSQPPHCLAPLPASRSASERAARSIKTLRQTGPRMVRHARQRAPRGPHLGHRRRRQGRHRHREDRQREDVGALWKQKCACARVVIVDRIHDHPSHRANVVARLAFSLPRYARRVGERPSPCCAMLLPQARWEACGGTWSIGEVSTR